MEAELAALDTAGAEVEWLRDFLLELPVVEKLIPAISMNCDNQTMITKVNSSRNNMKSTRHVKRRLKSVRKLKNSRVITVDYVHTSNNLADQFTKGLSRNVIESASREMGMRPMDAFLASVQHAPIFSIGLNCSFGAKQLKPFLEGLAAAHEKCKTIDALRHAGGGGRRTLAGRAHVPAGCYRAPVSYTHLSFLCKKRR